MELEVSTEQNQNSNLLAVKVYLKFKSQISLEIIQVK